MKERGHSANGMLVFLVYGMFSLFSLFLVVIGAKVYRELTEASQENTEIRAAFSYVANKVRMGGKAADAIRVEEREGIPVLSLRESYEEEEYETVIYFYDGALREYFAAVDAGFMPEAGERIAEAADVRIEETEAGQLRFTWEEEDGSWRSMHMSVPLSGQR